MFRANYEAVFLIGLVLMYAVRRYYGLIYRSRGVKEQGFNTPVDRLMTWASELGFVLGAIYLFTDWLAFANYPTAEWWSWAGVPVFGFGLWLLWNAHKDLDRSWSPHVEIQRNQKLITEHVYKHIRHPMYASYFLLGLGQVMMLANWIAGPAFIVLFGLLYLQRVEREENMMLKIFGEEYKAYMQRTGRLLPILNRRHSKSHPYPINTEKK